MEIVLSFDNFGLIYKFCLRFPDFVIVSPKNLHQIVWLFFLMPCHQHSLTLCIKWQKLPDTIKSAKKRIFQKLGVTNMAQAIIRSATHKLL